MAVRAVADAARLCRAVRDARGGPSGDLTPMVKDDASPVTVADFGAQAVVCRHLALAFPADPVMAEEDASALGARSEAARLAAVVRQVSQLVPEADGAAVCRWIDRGNLERAADRFWVLDPIDGTKGYVRGGQYAIALALVEAGEVVLGVLACPALPPCAGTGDTVGTVSDPGAALPPWAGTGAGPGPHGGAGCLLLAVRGQGAACARLAAVEAGGGPQAAGAGLSDGLWVPVRVSSHAGAADFRRCEPFESAHARADWAAAVAAWVGLTAPPVRLDSQAKYAVVARGEAELYLRLPSTPPRPERVWDHAAGALIVCEAGGAVTDADGRPLMFDRGPLMTGNRGIVASNGRRHAEIVAAIAATEGGASDAGSSSDVAGAAGAGSATGAGGA